MGVSVEKIAEDLGVQLDELLTESMIAYLEKRERECQAMRLEILTKYNVFTSQELEGKIKNGEIEEHPTWEDIITLDNLEESIKEVENELADLQKVGRVSFSRI